MSDESKYCSKCEAYHPTTQKCFSMVGQSELAPAPCSAVWRREPPDSPGNWLAWTTKKWNGNTHGYMHCVSAYWSPTNNAPDKRIAWCVPWAMLEWEGALWSGPVNPPNARSETPPPGGVRKP
jgi:hypothetical protein